MTAPVFVSKMLREAMLFLAVVVAEAPVAAQAEVEADVVVDGLFEVWVGDGDVEGVVVGGGSHEVGCVGQA